MVDERQTFFLHICDFTGGRGGGFHMQIPCRRLKTYILKQVHNFKHHEFVENHESFPHLPLLSLSKFVIVYFLYFFASRIFEKLVLRHFEIDSSMNVYLQGATNIFSQRRRLVVIIQQNTFWSSASIFFVELFD